MSMRWLVWCPERGETQEDGRPAYGASPREAAEAWAEYDDAKSAEYAIAGKGNVLEVNVMGPDLFRTTTRWRVSGEAVPEYRARPLP